jgi:peroxiredoxin
MKKTMWILLLAAAITVGTGYLFRDELRRASDSWQTRDMFVAAEVANFERGPLIGSRFPGLQALHGSRPVTLIEDFAGSNGTVLVALRSVDWCIFCKRQILQLQEYKPYFDAAGIGLLAISYDAPQVQAAFAQAHGITIPLLSDRETLSFRTLGILHEDYSDGDPEYGIPHPGIIIVDRKGVVAGKLFVESPQLRVESAEALHFARRALGLRAPFGND